VRLETWTSHCAQSRQSTRRGRETSTSRNWRVSQGRPAEIAAVARSPLGGRTPNWHSMPSGSVLAARGRPVLATAQRARAMPRSARDGTRRVRRPAGGCSIRRPDLSCAAVLCPPELADAALQLRPQRRTAAARGRTGNSRRPHVPRPDIGLRYVQAVLAAATMRGAVPAALGADLTGWPRDRGRVQLALAAGMAGRGRGGGKGAAAAARDTCDALG